MDPIAAIANAVGIIFETTTSRGSSRWENLPEWLRPTDFQKNDRTSEIIIASMAIAFIIIVISIAVIATKK
jgi:hypothetical protein